MIRKFDRYLIRQVLATTIFAVVLLSGVLVFGNIFKQIHEILVERGAGISFLWIFSIQLLPVSLVFTIPWDYLVPRKKRVRWLEIATTPNRISQAGIVLVSYGAIILWPPLVVSLATVGNPGVASALQAAGFLAVNGVATMMACLVLQRAMARSETVFAFSLSVWVVGVWILVPACPSLP